MKKTHYLLILFLLIFPFILPSYNENRHLDTLYWNKPIYFSPFELTKVMMWNNYTEELDSGEYCGFEKYENGEWVDLQLFQKIAFPAVGHRLEPDTEFVWGHTFPMEMFMPGRYRIWRHTYPDGGGIILYYAEFYYAGSILTISSIMVFILIILSSKMKVFYKIRTSINFLFFMFCLYGLHFLYGCHISYFISFTIFPVDLFTLAMVLVSFRFFDKTSRTQWRKEE